MTRPSVSRRETIDGLRRLRAPIPTVLSQEESDALDQKVLDMRREIAAGRKRGLSPRDANKFGL
jgi:hypothetical protein